MGSKLTHNELQAAVTTLDANRDGYIQVRTSFGFCLVCVACGVRSISMETKERAKSIDVAIFNCQI